MLVSMASSGGHVLCCMLALTRSVSTQAFVLHRSESPVLAYSSVHFRAHRNSSSRTACQRVDAQQSHGSGWTLLCNADSILKENSHQKHNLAPRHVACQAQRLEPFWQGVFLRRVCCSYLDNEAATTTSSPNTKWICSSSEELCTRKAVVSEEKYIKRSCIAAVSHMPLSAYVAS